MLTVPKVRHWIEGGPKGRSQSSQLDFVVHDATNDPRLGSVVPLVEVDALGQQLEPAKYTIIVYAGDCSSCAANDFEPHRLKAKPDHRIILLYKTDRLQSVPKRARELRRPYYLVLDPEERISAELNPSWSPRYYRLDGSNRLIDLQAEPSEVVPYASYEKE